MLNLYPMSIFQLILFVSFELLSSTDLTLLFALSDGLSFTCACKSSSFCRTWRISFGIGVVDRPTLGAHPNIVSYGDHFIPTWSCRFFWNCRRCMPVVQSVVLFSLIQRTSISWISPIDLRLGVSWLTMNNYWFMSQLLFVIKLGVNSRPD